MKKLFLFLSIVVLATGLIHADEVQKLKNKKTALKKEMKMWKDISNVSDLFFFTTIFVPVIELITTPSLATINTLFVSRCGMAFMCAATRALVMMNQFQIDKINTRLAKIEAEKVKETAQV